MSKKKVPKWRRGADKALKLIAEAHERESHVDWPEDRPFPEDALCAAEKVIGQLTRKLGRAMRELNRIHGGAYEDK